MSSRNEADTVVGEHLHSGGVHGDREATGLATRRQRRLVLAGFAGNVMEWYDFTVYGYFAVAIGKQFFPSQDPLSSLLASFGAFAAGFLMRPVGSLIFGHIGDRVGRGAALSISVAVMAVPTFLIGVLPTHGQIGTAATVLLILLRLLQGLAVGGECGTSFTFLVEQAPSGRRGLYGSWGSFGVGCGVLLGSAVGALVTAILGETAVADWGWRVPFLLGIAVGLCGLSIRRGLAAGVREAARSEPAPPASPIGEAFRTEWRSILRILGLNAANAVGFYLCFVFVVSYLQRIDHLGASTALNINTAAMLVMLVVTPAAGALSDRIGRRPMLLAAMTALLVLAWPLFWLLHHPTLWVALLGQLGFAALVGCLSGITPATMVEAAPRRVRCTTLSFGLNLGFGVLGGMTPLVAVYLIGRSHDDLSPAILLMAAAVISLLTTLRLRETSGIPLA